MIVPKNVHLEFSLANLTDNSFDQSIPIKIVLIIIVIFYTLFISCLWGWLRRVLPSLHCAVFARFMQTKSALNFCTIRFQTGKAIFVLVNLTIRVRSSCKCEYLILFIKEMCLTIYNFQ